MIVVVYKTMTVAIHKTLW